MMMIAIITDDDRYNDNSMIVGGSYGNGSVDVTVVIVYGMYCNTEAYMAII